MVPFSPKTKLILDQNAKIKQCQWFHRKLFALTLNIHSVVEITCLIKSIIALSYIHTPSVCLSTYMHVCETGRQTKPITFNKNKSIATFLCICLKVFFQSLEWLLSAVHITTTCLPGDHWNITHVVLIGWYMNLPAAVVSSNDLHLVYEPFICLHKLKNKQTNLILWF